MHVDHNATIPQHLAIEQRGMEYRVVRQRIEAGAIVDVQPVDGLIFDSLPDARRHLAACRADAR